jgi:hypothetical protein
MGVLASESVASNFEQRSHVAQLEAHYREAMEVAQEVEASERSEAPVVAPPFSQESVPAK